VSIGELYQGFHLSLRPERPTKTTIEIKSAEFALTAPLVVASQRSLGQDNTRIWSLVAGDAALGSSGRFEVPVNLQLQTVKNNEVVPILAESSYVFTLKDVGADKELGKLTLPERNALSNSIWVPIDVDHSRELIATSESDHLDTNPLTLSWDRNGPQLSIAAVPPQPAAFATFRTRANIGLYFSYKGRLVTPPYATEIFASAPPSIALSPPSPIKMQPPAEYASTDIISTTFGGTDGTIRFHEPRSASIADVQVSFVFPWTYYGLAFLSGLIGALIADRNNLSSMSRLDFLKAVFGGSVAGLLLYMAALAGWSVISPSVVVLVGAPSAILIGFVGGVSVDTVVKVLKGASLLPTP
jgi:hypothetical protein